MPTSHHHWEDNKKYTLTMLGGWGCSKSLDPKSPSRVTTHRIPSTRPGPEYVIRINN